MWFMPRIITAREQGLSFANRFGALGPELNLTGHHSAGAQPKTLGQALALVKSYHHAHAAKGWGGLGYHYVIAPTGEIICGRPTLLLGAHVGGHNSNNIGVLFPGTTGDHPTAAQSISYRWLLRNAHTWRMPKAHRTDRDLRKAKRRGHNDWPGHQSNACPGTHKYLILNATRNDADRKAHGE